jgi:hypothetical protein
MVSCVLAEKDAGIIISASSGVSSLYRSVTSFSSEQALSNMLKIKMKEMHIFFFTAKATLYISN